LPHRVAGWFTLPSTDPSSSSSEQESLLRRTRGGEDMDSAEVSDSSSESGSTAQASFTKPSPSKEPLAGTSSTDYPSPNISVGPPIHPSPHLLPYLYPHGFYPGHNMHQLLGQHPPPLSLFTGGAPPGIHPQLLFNAQLALAAQHPLFGHAYPGLGSVLTSSTSPTQGGAGPLLSERLKAAHRFAPYGAAMSGGGGAPTTPSTSLLGASPLGSAFETVTPGSLQHSPRHSPRPTSTESSAKIATPTPITPKIVSPQPPPTSPPATPKSLNNNRTTSSSPKAVASSSPPPPPSSDLKSIEKMVNGLDKGDVTAVEKVDK